MSYCLRDMGYWVPEYAIEALLEQALEVSRSTTPPLKGEACSSSFRACTASERDRGTLGWLTTTVSTDLCAGLTV